MDTLRAKSEYPIKNLFISSHDSTKEFEITYDDFLDSSKRAFFYYKRWKRKILYLNVYFKNNGHPEQIEDLFWYQDYDGQIKRMFNKISDGLKMIILHPNGDYYLESSETKLPYDNLFLKKRWDIYKQEFDNKLKALKLNATQPQ
ncbi:hypothetical protein [Seonamhaeicola sp. ML3]|uniref:hypothetical protein n=1 Tax=Seonamhaeicola sp. ML3 TaxID=2937786 RepID=UPI00200CFDDD|nr:hypothetical protein [Seonamhaeicola sp. ML3]